MSTLTQVELEKVQACIRDVRDFPKPGITFKDITPLLKNHAVRECVLLAIGNEFKHQNIDAVAAIEARGFLFGMAIAQYLQVPFVPIRKAGKLPYDKKSAVYNLEYGQASIEIHNDAFRAGERVLIHDDVLATGGTAAAAGGLIERLGARVAAFSFIIELSFLGGAVNLNRQFGVHSHSLLTY
jgi:adenine phosphoribosyltransferase